MNKENTKLRMTFVKCVVILTGEYVPIIGQFPATPRTNGVLSNRHVDDLCDGQHKRKDDICDNNHTDEIKYNK
jgi:hypothetical protein